MTDERLQCVGCGKGVPDSDSGEDSTFTSASGWRLRLRETPGGGRHPEWRCPECWKAFKAARRPE